jgi:hypothetical protein
MKNIIVCSLLLVLYSCSDTTKGITFSKSSFDGTWPFSVEEVEVYCSGYKEIYCRDVAGKIYALNGSAKSASKDDKTMSKVEEIWLDNPEYPGLKIPYSEFITQGLELCENK